MKNAPEKPYTLKEISAIHGIPVDILQYRCVKRKLRPTVMDGKFRYYLDHNQMLSVLDKSSRAELIPEVIYVHTTWLVLESKMNKK
jgi:hypothetical protein